MKHSKAEMDQFIVDDIVLDLFFTAEPIHLDDDYRTAFFGEADGKTSSGHLPVMISRRCMKKFVRTCEIGYTVGKDKERPDQKEWTYKMAVTLNWKDKYNNDDGHGRIFEFHSSDMTERQRVFLFDIYRMSGAFTFFDERARTNIVDSCIAEKAAKEFITLLELSSI